MKKTVLLSLILCIITTALSACSIFKKQSVDTSAKTYSFTVHYYENKTTSYSFSKSDNVIKTNFIAPSGKIITGLFDENDVQYASYDCEINLKTNPTIPNDLYAKYEDVDISYLDDDPFSAYDENPQSISFYSGGTLTWEFNPSQYPVDQKMISACLCNPYADLIITVSFLGKSDAGNHENVFYSKLTVCNETIGSFEMEDFASASTYTKYSYSGTIKAKQLTNGNYKISVNTSAKLGYADYTIKNYKIDFKFIFDSIS